MCADPGVPDNDIWRHMPPPDGEEEFFVQKKNMFSNDYNVFKGDQPSEDQRYLWMNKEGSWTSGRAYINIENFHLKTDGEPSNANDEGRGQILWRADFTDKPHFEQHVSWAKGCHERFLGFYDGYESDEDDHYFDRASPVGVKLFNKFLVKFSCQTSATIKPGKTKKGVNLRPGLLLKLKVFAKGTAVRKITRTWTTERDDEGTVTGGHWSYQHHDHEFVDWIEYKLVRGDVCVAIFRCEGMSNSSNTWDCPIFSCSKEGGDDIKVETLPGWDPLLGLMLAHLVSTEYSPENIRKDFTPQFPPDTHYRRSHRPMGMHWYAPEEEARDPEMINGSEYTGGIAIQPEMFQALPGYEREFHYTPPYWDVEEAEAEAAAAAEAEEEAAAAAEAEEEAKPAAEAKEEKPKIEIDWGDLEATAPKQEGLVLRKVPAHMEMDEETGLLKFVPISFETLTPPPIVEDKVEDEIEVLLEESDDSDSDDDEKKS